MAEWSLYYYVEPNGRCPMSEWLGNLPDAHEAHIIEKMNYFEQRRVNNAKLIKPYVSWPGIFEFRPTFEGIAYRPLMCAHPTDNRGMVFLEGAREENRKIKRKHLEKADTRRRNLVEDPSRAKLRDY